MTARGRAACSRLQGLLESRRGKGDVAGVVVGYGRALTACQRNSRPGTITGHELVHRGEASKCVTTAQSTVGDVREGCRIRRRLRGIRNVGNRPLKSPTSSSYSSRAQAAATPAINRKNTVRQTCRHPLILPPGYVLKAGHESIAIGKLVSQCPLNELTNVLRGKDMIAPESPHSP